MAFERSPPVRTATLTASFDFNSVRRLAGKEEGFDQLAFATNSHAGKCLEPFSIGNFGLLCEPIRQLPELIGGNIPGFDAFQQMRIQWSRKIAASDAGHGYSP